MSSKWVTVSRHPSSRVLQLIIPLALVGMMGSAITFLRGICTGDVRWLILGFLFLLFILKQNLLRFFELKFSFLLFLYLSWCLFTSFWSTIPALSFMKSGIFILLTLTMIRVGLEWVRINPINKALDYLWLLGFILLFSSIISKTHSDSIIPNGNVTMYQGLIRGANMFGTLLAMCLPYFIWKLYCASRIKIKLLILASITCFLYFLMLSFCRSAMLMSLMTIVGLVVSLNLRKKVLITISVLIASLCVLIVSPGLFINVTRGILFKGYSTNLFYSRQNVWGATLEGAKEGSLFGLGYGISAGRGEFNFNFADGFKSYVYGREKGNSQLAIIEETGLIGLFLYVSILLALIAKLFFLYLKTDDQNIKVLIGITGGTFLGIIAHSVFEGWWTSPGSQESIYFWMLVGVILGIEKTLSYPHRVMKNVKT